MFGGDEIIFAGAYKDLKLGVRFDLSGKSPADVAGILAYISAEIEPYAFRLSGIDTKQIESFAKPKGRGIPAVCDFINANSSEWNSLLKQMLKEPKLKAAADSYLFNRLLTNAGVAFKTPAKEAKGEKEEITDQIAFIGRYKDWVSIKKLGMEKAKDYEVSGILAGINFSIVNKAFDFAGIEKDDAKVKAAARGKRKALSNASEALREVDGSNAYVVCKVLEELGYRPYASSHMLTDAYPDIKPPKVRGRKPKA